MDLLISLELILLFLLFKPWMSSRALSCASDLDLCILLSFTIFLLTEFLCCSWEDAAVSLESFLSLISFLSFRHMMQLSSFSVSLLFFSVNPFGCGASLLWELRFLTVVAWCLAVLGLITPSLVPSFRLSSWEVEVVVTSSASLSSSSRFSSFLLTWALSTDPVPRESLDSLHLE